MAKPNVRSREKLADGTVVTTVIVQPGELLPKGVFVNGWKLDTGSYGPGKIYLMIKEEP